MLDVRRPIGRRRQRRMFSAAGLNTGLFVCADDVIICTQWGTLPDTLVKIEDGSGFSGKVRIAGKDSASNCGRSPWRRLSVIETNDNEQRRQTDETEAEASARASVMEHCQRFEAECSGVVWRLRCG